MKRTLLFLGGLLSSCLFLLSFGSFDSIDKDEEIIKELIISSYVNGAFNDLNPEAMEKAFHPDFAIFSAQGEELNRYEIDEWVERTRKKKNDPEFDPSKNIWDHEIEYIDVTGSAASLKIKYFREGNLVYTDYISLLKFESGWKIVAKVYEYHGKK